MECFTLLGKRLSGVPLHDRISLNIGILVGYSYGKQ